jgi:hypothetical protein
MNSSTSDRDTNQVTGNMEDARAQGSPADGGQRTEALGGGLDHVGSDHEPAVGTRRAKPRPLLFLLVLTGVVMVFAIAVAVWMYWLAPAFVV